ncbi:hypothetical protein N7533_012484 [Penicillium manginii]|uniref:uncharacterized protein n=1 Tax=Penicillium manginii TaxID=203109 RepID=UPI0025484E82|nr:uncharacterized protein N7533_012484 [Penicillium manginii]KAJ5739700.1 hypothetical protein N7533_012484 [Penicillium manginii]
MSSSILHQCPSCGHISDISQSLAAFIENPHCTQCGMSASESSSKIQDELAMLFDRQMTMSMTPTHDEAIPISQPNQNQNQNLTYSITQHYNHSAHVASSAPTTSTLQATNQADSLAPVQDIHAVLRHNGLDPATFSVGQLELFRNADAAQQQRLIQTWQFYSTPHSSPLQDMDMNDDAMAEFVEYHGEQAEPYMSSGYGVEAVENASPVEPSTGKPYDSSTDPVYRGAQEWWEMPRTSSMESQYGLFEERSRHYSNSDSTWQPQVGRCFH